jgi:hypothetical protein
MLVLLLTAASVFFIEACEPRLEAANEAEPCDLRIYFQSHFYIGDQMVQVRALVS